MIAEMWFIGLLLSLFVAADAAPLNSRYAVIFDCGSTGTRVHVFSWTDTSHDSRLVGGLPDILAVPGGNMKVKPGISSFEAHPEKAGTSIVPLLEMAEKVVPAPEHSRALVLLRATAGMRLVARRRAQRIYNSLFDAVLHRGTFTPQRAAFGTLSGEDEGVFGWLCANYLLQRAGRIRELGSVGALDLGGGSTQLTLATTQHAAETSMIDPRLAAEVTRPHAAPPPRVRLPGGREVSVYSRSHLGFGNKAVLAALSAHEAAACLASGATSEWEPSNKSGDYTAYLNRGANEGPYALKGRGDFAACDAAVARVLGSFDRSGQPPLHGSRTPLRFVAMSLFFYVHHFADVAGLIGARPTGAHADAAASAANGAAPLGAHAVSAEQLHAAAMRLCAEPDSQLRRMVGKDPLTTEDALRWRCFDLTYAARLLTDGYGFSSDAAAVEFLGEVDGVEVEWTLGALLHELLHEGSNAAAHEAHADQRTKAGVGSGHVGRDGSGHFMAVALLCFGGLTVLLLRHLMRRSSHSRSPRVSVAKD